MKYVHFLIKSIGQHSAKKLRHKSTFFRFHLGWTLASNFPSTKVFFTRFLIVYSSQFVFGFFPFSSSLPINVPLSTSSQMDVNNFDDIKFCENFCRPLGAAKKKNHGISFTSVSKLKRDPKGFVCLQKNPLIASSVFRWNW